MKKTKIKFSLQKQTDTDTDIYLTIVQGCNNVHWAAMCWITDLCALIRRSCFRYRSLLLISDKFENGIISE